MTDPERCCARVLAPGMGIRLLRQCSRLGVVLEEGSGALYCKQHSPQAVKKRIDATTKAWEESSARRNRPFIELQRAKAALADIAAICDRTDTDTRRMVGHIKARLREEANRED